MKMPMNGQNYQNVSGPRNLSNDPKFLIFNYYLICFFLCVFFFISPIFFFVQKHNFKLAAQNWVSTIYIFHDVTGNLFPIK